LIAWARWSTGPRPDQARSPSDRWWALGFLAAAFALVAGPFLGLTVVWPARLDLVALPLFVTGATVALFGLPVARAQRLALAFLLLGWTLPYMIVLFRVLPPFSDLTLGAIRQIIHVLRVARPSNVGGGTDFLVGARHGLRISVAATCSGISSFFGFLLLGGAATVLLAGPRRRKAIWVALGLALCWVVNLARILGIFAIAGTWGEHVALDDIHPYAGIVLFTLTTAVVAAMAPRLGLRWREPLFSPTDKPTADPPGPREASTAPPNVVTVSRSSGVPAAAAIVAAAALLVAVADARLARFDPTRSVARTRGATAAGETPTLTGWSVITKPGPLWASPYFGETSGWARFVAIRGDDPDAVVSIDLIDSSQLEALASYGVNAYYGGFRVASAHPIRIAPGVEGVELRSFAGWPTVAWTRRVGVGHQDTFEEVFVTARRRGAAAVSDVEAAARGLAQRT
jgi:exosortase/archaeosortase family protein